MVSCFISPLRKGVRGILLGKILQNMVKCFFYLSFLYFELIFISDREPLRTTIELVSWQERDFERRLLHDIEFLSFVVRFSLLQHSHIHDTSGDTSSRNDDFATIRRDTESLPSEDELIDGDVFEYLIFWHKNNPRKDARIIETFPGIANTISHSISRYPRVPQDQSRRGHHRQQSSELRSRVCTYEVRALC